MLPSYHPDFFDTAPILSGLGLPTGLKFRGFRSSALNATSASFSSVYQRSEIIALSYWRHFPIFQNNYVAADLHEFAVALDFIDGQMNSVALQETRLEVLHRNFFWCFGPCTENSQDVITSSDMMLHYLVNSTTKIKLIPLVLRVQIDAPAIPESYPWFRSRTSTSSESE